MPLTSPPRRVALVTGAAGGIGRAVVGRLTADGMRVVPADLPGRGATAPGPAPPDTEAPVPLDVTDEAACRAAVAEVLARHGRIDALVNVAGIGAMARTAELDPATWERVLRVNLTGTFLMCRAALPHLPPGGAVVNLGSVAGTRASPYNAAYAASKAGVISLTRTLAAEYAHAGVRVTCVCPGAVDTPFLAGFRPPEDADLRLLARAAAPLPGGPARPAEVAGAVAYLLSGDAAHVTGTTLVIDGGSTA